MNERQTAMFTATWPNEVRTLARDFIRDPIIVQVGSTDPLTGNKDITQHIRICDNDNDKRRELMDILNEMKNTEGNALIFCATKSTVKDLQYNLSKRERVPCTCMHGDMEQRERDNNLWNFKKGNDRVMVATDVCARGLDVRNISIVINWDPANNAEDHTHRVGRTGRAGDTGNAYTFLGSRDRDKAKQVLYTVKKAGQDPPRELLELAGMSGGGGRGGGGAGWGSGGGWGSSW